MPMPPPEIAVAGFLLLLAALVVPRWLSSQLRRARRRAWAAASRTLGWSAPGRHALAAALHGFDLAAEAGVIVAGLVGDLDSASVALVDVYLPKGDLNEVVTVCVVRDPRLHLPRCRLVPRKSPSVEGLVPIADDAFSGRYSLLSDDETDARSTFGPELRRWLLAQQGGIWFEGRGGAFLFHRLELCLPRRIAETLDDARQVLQILRVCAGRQEVPDV
jgi:hypothetical protein